MCNILNMPKENARWAAQITVGIGLKPTDEMFRKFIIIYNNLLRMRSLQFD